MVRKGTRVHEGFEKRHDFKAHADDSHVTIIRLFVSPRADVKYIDEEGVQELGSVRLPMVKGQTGSISLGFGSTEIEVAAINNATGVKTRTSIDFKFSAL